MSADAALGYPCDYCKAQAGEPCAEGCPGADELELALAEAIDATDVYAVPPMDESLARLAAAVHYLPYGGLVGIRGAGAPDRQDYDPDEYVARLADWMQEYQQVLRAMVDDLQVQARQRIGLQIEKDAVRAFFGKVDA